MSKRLSLLILLVFTLLALTAAPALAATCSLCGGEADNADYLCTDCLVQLLNAERNSGGLEITGAGQGADGVVTLTWTDAEGNAPYAVRYELLEPAPVPFGWTAAEGLQDTSCALTRLVPGVSYVLTVVDSQEHSARITYCAPVPGEENTIGAALRVKPTLRSGTNNAYPERFSVSEVITGGKAHGLNLRVTYSTLRQAHRYAYQFTVTAPNGFSDVVFSGVLELDSGRSTLPAWDFIPLDDYFALLQEHYGSLPTGQYEVTLFLNGSRATSTLFVMLK